MSEKAKQVLLVVGGVILIVAIIAFQVWRARPAPPVVPAESASTPATDPAGETAPPALPVASLPTTVLPAPTRSADPETAVLEATEILAGQWGRNPFLTLDEIAALNREPEVPIIVALPEPEPAPPPEMPQYTVSTIVSGDKGAWAVVGSRVVRPGDRLGTETVKQINSDGVVLEHNGETRVILLKRSILFVPGPPRGGNE